MAFAMTSRRPEPFDEIARQVSEEKAADFHERWVLGYGHASVAEHAVVHLPWRTSLGWPATGWKTTGWRRIPRSPPGTR